MRFFVALRAVIFAGTFFLLWFWIATLLRAFDGAFGGLLPIWTRPLGWGVMVVGGGLAVWCVALFVVEGRGTPAVFDPPRRLVARGPYRFVRNPMYIGGGALLAGFGLELRSPTILLFLPVWVMLVHVMVTGYEEPNLGRKFGAEYQDYCKRTPRWLPRFRPAAGVVFLLLFLFPGPPRSEAGAKPNFSGEWILNAAKSEFGRWPRPDSQTCAIEHTEPRLQVHTKRVHGDRNSRGAWDCLIDAGPCKVKLTGTGLKLSSRARWDDAVLVLESWGDYDGTAVRLLDRWSLSADGLVLTIVRRLSNQLGEAHQTIVLEKRD